MLKLVYSLGVFWLGFNIERSIQITDCNTLEFWHVFFMYLFIATTVLFSVVIRDVLQQKEVMSNHPTCWTGPIYLHLCRPSFSILHADLCHNTCAGACGICNHLVCSPLRDVEV